MNQRQPLIRFQKHLKIIDESSLQIAKKSFAWAKFNITSGKDESNTCFSPHSDQAPEEVNFDLKFEVQQLRHLGQHTLTVQANLTQDSSIERFYFCNGTPHSAKRHVLRFSCIENIQEYLNRCFQSTERIVFFEKSLCNWRVADLVGFPARMDIVFCQKHVIGKWYWDLTQFCIDNCHKILHVGRVKLTLLKCLNGKWDHQMPFLDD